MNEEVVEELETLIQILTIKEQKIMEACKAMISVSCFLI